MTTIRSAWLIGFVGLLLLCGCTPTAENFLRRTLESIGEHPHAQHVILPEEHRLHLRDPQQLPSVPLPDVPNPRTVRNPQEAMPEWQLSLDEAIRIALKNARVVRVLAGISAVSSGQTIYDTAITSTAIDQVRSVFDPNFSWRNGLNRVETPVFLRDAISPALGIIAGSSNAEYRSIVGLSKTNVLGGQWTMNWIEAPTQLGGLGANAGLNPQNRSSFELGYTQPLLQGAGFAVNTAPIVLARIDTERSFFVFKDSVQDLVRGVIEGYWQLVLARVNVWALQIQVEQSQEALQLAEARKNVGLSSAGPVAQAKVTYNQFRASLIAAKANLLAREGALRNILGLPPEDMRRIVPHSPPINQRLPYDWKRLVAVAEQNRPDIIERKLALQSDNVRLLQATNLTIPRLDASTLYRWNGLSGQTPNGRGIASDFGQFTDWSLGLNFSLPLGLRDGRARERLAQLQILRDRANLEQALHATIHTLAINVRELDNSYEQYEAFKRTREAARENLEIQIQEFRTRRNIYLDVLQALTSWGSAVTSEAQALISYNVNLANLERETGTILETHGLQFFEESRLFPGPCGICAPDEPYPGSLKPTGEPKRYPGQEKPAENLFELEKPDIRSPREKEKTKDKPKEKAKEDTKGAKPPE